ncbi:MAG: hypothetical protein IJS63_06980 [Bacteroidaceae bacterium]|nr:hypothetical protein [Bacteroidaceae bacterium]
MNEQEFNELFKLLEAQGWKPMLCDTPVPFYDGRVPCGTPNDLGDVVCEMAMMPREYLPMNRVFCATVTGDSMKDANIFAGDIVVVESGVSISDGDIVLARIDGECTLKTYCEDENGMPWLVPQNAEYDAFPLEESQSVYVAGRVRDIIRQAPRIKYKSCLKFINRAKARQQEPEEIPQLRISQAIREIAPTITVARQWYAVFKVMMDLDVVKMWDYDGFCSMIKEELPDGQHLPSRLELQRMAVGCFAKSVVFWTESDAPVKGKRFDAYKSLALKTKELLKS